MISIVLLSVSIIYYHRSNLKLININKKCIANEYRPLSFFKNSRFQSDMCYKAFFIHPNVQESFNIFIKLAPDILLTISKADKRFNELIIQASDSYIDKAVILSELNEIDNLLIKFVDATHSILKKMHLDQINILNENHDVIRIEPDLIYLYIDLINTFYELSDSHSDINCILLAKLLDKYPDLTWDYINTTSKIIYILYINIITYSNMLNENIFIYE